MEIDSDNEEFKTTQEEDEEGVEEDFKTTQEDEINDGEEDEEEEEVKIEIDDENEDEENEPKTKNARKKVTTNKSKYSKKTTSKRTTRSSTKKATTSAAATINYLQSEGILINSQDRRKRFIFIMENEMEMNIETDEMKIIALPHPKNSGFFLKLKIIEFFLEFLKIYLF